MFRQHAKVMLVVWTALALFAFPALYPEAVAKKPKIEGKININTATPEQLRLLPRVGPKIAMRIVKYRKKHPFRKPSDLMKVKGIGPKTYLKLKALITTQGPTKFRLVPRK